MTIDSPAHTKDRDVIDVRDPICAAIGFSPITDMMARDRRLMDSFLTERLVATRLHDTDLGDLYRMHQDGDVMATLGGVRSEE